MIYLLYGENEDKAREKAHKLLNSLLSKKPDANLFQIDSDNFDEASFEEYVKGQSLFEKRYIVYCNKISENSEALSFIKERIKDIAASDNIFIFIEGKPKIELVSLFKKHSEKIQEFPAQGGPASGWKDRNNHHLLFAIGDALGAKDGRRAWLSLQRALISGFRPEEIHPILFWQVKNMILVKEMLARGGSAMGGKKLGLKPFPFKKAVSFAKNYTEEELRKLSGSLVKIYHDSRFGVSELDIALERFILSI